MGCVKEPVTPTFLLSSCATHPADDYDGNQNTGRNVVNGDDGVMRTLPGGDCLLKLFSWLALWDQRRLDILSQPSPGGLLEVLKDPHLQWLTANAR